MHVGWTRPGMGVVAGLDGSGDGPTSVRGALMDFDEVQLAGDGELVVRSPYQTWRPEDTRVISYVLAFSVPSAGAREPDVLATKPARLRAGWRSASSVKVARAEVQREFGEILEENAAGDNVFFRVRKAAK